MLSVIPYFFRALIAKLTKLSQAVKERKKERKRERKKKKERTKNNDNINRTVVTSVQW
jgi:hypothetical protein